MEIASFVELFDQLKHDELCFAYSGNFSDSISTKIIDIARTSIETKGRTAGFKNKVSFLMGECYQNIVRHGINPFDTFSSDEKWSVFFVRNLYGKYFITSSNRISNSEIPYLRCNLDRVNSMSSEELKELQKQIVMKGKISPKGGAGIGIIMMARKTGQILEYSFEPLNEDTSLFYLHVQFQDPESTHDESVKKTVTLESMSSLHQKLVSERVLILHKGDFSNETFLPVLKMIESNIGERLGNKFSSTKIYHITVEILQNISLHSFKFAGTSEGLFFLGISEGHFYIATCNYVENSKAKKLQKHLNELNRLSKDQLNQLYKNKLKLVIEGKDEGVGLGLIDIFRDSSKVQYSIEQKGDVALYSIIVKI